MKEYTNECVGCPPEMGCLSNRCPHMNVPHLYCDECMEEVEELYEFEGDELCIECIKDRLVKIELDD